MSNYTDEKNERSYSTFEYDSNSPTSQTDAELIKEGIKAESRVAVLKICIAAFCILIGAVLLIFGISAGLFSASEIATDTFTIKNLSAPVGVILILAGIFILYKTNVNIKKK